MTPTVAADVQASSATPGPYDDFPSTKRHPSNTSSKKRGADDPTEKVESQSCSPERQHHDEALDVLAMTGGSIHHVTEQENARVLAQIDW